MKWLDSVKYYFHHEEFIFWVQVVSKKSPLVKGAMSLFVHLETVQCNLTKLIKGSWYFQSAVFTWYYRCT